MFSSALDNHSSVHFLFSSRSRHTRYWRDWSSDVCSSDLHRCGAGRVARAGDGRARPPALARGGGLATARSEERRVGKECRTQWSLTDKKHSGGSTNNQREGSKTTRYVICRLVGKW